MIRNRTVICNITAGVTTLLAIVLVEFLLNPAGYVQPTRVSAAQVSPTARASEVVVMPRAAPVRSIERVETRRSVAVAHPR